MHGSGRSVTEQTSFPVDTLMENVSDGILLVNDQWQINYVNSQALDVTGFSKEQVLQRLLFEVFPESVNTQFEKACHKVMKTGKSEAFEAPFGPGYILFWTSVFKLNDNTLCIAFHESTMKRRLEIVAHSQREALSVALAGGDQSEVLTIITEAVERQAGYNVAAVISLVSEDETHLYCGAAPSLPVSMQKQLTNMPIDSQNSPCSNCFTTRRITAINAFEHEERWPTFCQTALDAGYNAHWCMPILSTRSKSVLGTFSVFYTQTNGQWDSDQQVVDALTRTAAIVIERNRENQARLKAESALTANTETLNKQRRLYETALSNTPDLIYVFDLQGRFTYANDALLEMWGRTWEESVGKTCFELGYEPWHAEMHMREIRQVIKTKKPIRGDVPFDGTHGRRIYDYIFVPVIGDDGNVEAVAGSTRDVTERKEAEELAKKAEARRRLALEASHSFGIWDWDIKTNTFTADERLAELFNITAEQATQGVAIAEPLKSIHPDDFPRIKKAIDESISHGCPYDEEYRIIQQNGSVRWASFRGRVIYDNQGEPSRFPGVGVDVTREREAIDALQEADKRKDEFLATLAHELRNPLAPIRNALAIVQSTQFSREQKDEAFKLVERQVTQMIQLVDDLMDISRITRGKIRLNRKPLDIREVLNTAVETVAPFIEECAHKLSFSYPEETIWVDGDLIRLSQIFSNIINNAAKYTPKEGEIVIVVTQEKHTVQVLVKDNGAGIPSDKLENIFEMFSQVDNVLERSQGGLGIGLTLVRRLTELHDGTVSVTSDGLDKGTTFSVSLPCIPEPEYAEMEADAVPDSPEEGSARINVLIADDNQDAAITMGWILEAKGCLVKVVENGKDALKAVETFIPDLVLLDIGMPDMNGYDLCVALRQNEALDNAIFVAQTGWGQPSHIKRSKEAGFAHHLVKPLDLNDLTPLVSKARQVKAQNTRDN
ncbi:PAS domain S-box protein [Salinimonas chungwhensis]|uniref:PAS domain S-box protein n=1 Tax=Salinimonas chungwhensis TaxID=265425 RepID=UPI000366959C|nr:PAS domain S-box protein [Salinimonas chungwhensis]